jgi:hypothetical protein
MKRSQKMTPYNGHRSWAAWDVSLWLSSDESLYNRSRRLIQEKGVEKAARLLLKELPTKTPDGAVYNYTNIYLAIKDFVD